LRLCRLMCGRGFALSEGAGFFHGAMPRSVDALKSTERAGTSRIRIKTEAQGRSAEIKARLSRKGRSHFRTSGGAAAKKSC
jgi:hypothetical protein